MGGHSVSELQLISISGPPPKIRSPRKTARFGPRQLGADFLEANRKHSGAQSRSPEIHASYMPIRGNHRRPVVVVYRLISVIWLKSAPLTRSPHSMFTYRGSCGGIVGRHSVPLHPTRALAAAALKVGSELAKWTRVGRIGSPTPIICGRSTGTRIKGCHLRRHSRPRPPSEVLPVARLPI